MPIFQFARRFSLKELLLAVAILSGLCFVGQRLPQTTWWNGGVKPVPFDAAAWQRAAPIEGYRTIRIAMVDDLLRRYSFRSWGRQQVVELLGEPDADQAKVGFPGWDLAYFLGLERGGSLSLDDEYLLFRFGASGEVVEYRTSVN